MTPPPETNTDALSILLHDLKTDVREGFAGIRDELRTIDRRQTLERRELDERINGEVRRLDARIDDNRSRLDVATGQAKGAGRWWGMASSLGIALLLWLVTGRL